MGSGGRGGELPYLLEHERLLKARPGGTRLDVLGAAGIAERSGEVAVADIRFALTRKAG